MRVVVLVLVNMISFDSLCVSESILISGKYYLPDDHAREDYIVYDDDGIFVASGYQQASLMMKKREMILLRAKTLWTIEWWKSKVWKKYVKIVQNVNSPTREKIGIIFFLNEIHVKCRRKLKCIMVPSTKYQVPLPTLLF